MDSITPRVCIGMPVYNGEKFIEATIKSILAQTYFNFEFIISDNASTDKTQQICLAYMSKDNRIRYYRNDRNLGAAPNYNHVFELSACEFFKWADYDDLLAPQFLTRCIQIMDQDPEIALCFPSARIIDENDEALGNHIFKSDTSSHKPCVRFRNLVLNPDMAYQVSGVMRSREVRKTALHGSYPSSDLVFLAELSLYGRFYKIPEYLFFPRYHPDQSTKGTLSIERNRTVFFDTSNEGRILLPKWMLLFGYIRAINKGPIKWPEKLYCAMQMVRWVLKPDHLRALGKDILLAIQKGLILAFTKSKEKS